MLKRSKWNYPFINSTDKEADIEPHPPRQETDHPNEPLPVNDSRDKTERSIEDNELLDCEKEKRDIEE